MIPINPFQSIENRGEKDKIITLLGENVKQELHGRGGVQDPGWKPEGKKLINYITLQ